MKRLNLIANGLRLRRLSSDRRSFWPGLPTHRRRDRSSKPRRRSRSSNSANDWSRSASTSGYRVSARPGSRATSPKIGSHTPSAVDLQREGRLVLPIGRPWAEITYHYGRWYDDPDQGWVWVAGTEWAPLGSSGAGRSSMSAGVRCRRRTLRAGQAPGPPPARRRAPPRRETEAARTSRKRGCSFRAGRIVEEDIRTVRVERARVVEVFEETADRPRRASRQNNRELRAPAAGARARDARHGPVAEPPAAAGRPGPHGGEPSRPSRAPPRRPPRRSRPAPHRPRRARPRAAAFRHHRDGCGPSPPSRLASAARLRPGRTNPTGTNPSGTPTPPATAGSPSAPTTAGSEPPARTSSSRSTTAPTRRPARRPAPAARYRDGSGCPGSNRRHGYDESRRVA